jgi:hypothetical protein
MGLRTHVAMMYDPRNRAKAQGKEGSKGSKFSYDEVVTVKLAKGVGRRAALGRAQGIKAGIPEEGLKVPFDVDQLQPACNQPATSLQPACNPMPPACSPLPPAQADLTAVQPDLTRCPSTWRCSTTRRPRRRSGSSW